MAKKDKKEQTSFSGKKGYDMLRDMIGPGTFKKPKQESLLPKFFKFVPDPYTATDKIMDKIKKKAKKKAGGGLTKTVPPKRGPNSQGLKGGGDFDPEGKGYDYKTFDKLGGERDSKGHGFSRNPKTGMLLKGRKHDTFSKGVGVDENLGYGLKKKGDRYYTEKLKRGIPAGKYKDMSKFSKGGCPHREVGAKSDIQGIKDIQVKGKKFTGVK